MTKTELTDAEIDALEPGWMMDLWIIKKVPLGVQTRFCPGADKCQILRNGEWVDFAPSTDANQTLEVAARALPHWRISHDSTAAETELWLVEWGPGDQVVWEDHWVRAATFPEAVCKAALKAVRT